MYTLIACNLEAYDAKNCCFMEEGAAKEFWKYAVPSLNSNTVTACGLLRCDKPSDALNPQYRRPHALLIPLLISSSSRLVDDHLARSLCRRYQLCTTDGAWSRCRDGCSTLLGGLAEAKYYG